MFTEARNQKEQAAPGDRPDLIIRHTCRVCDGALEPVLSLGEQFVSDFPAPEQPDGPKAPLDLVLCTRCRLLQLRHTVAANAMYQNYWYRSGTNETMRNALADITASAERLIALRAGDAVLDIGCNDGTLLGSYRTPGLYKIGFDPARNLRVFSTKVANKVCSSYFSAEEFLADEDLAQRRPKVVTSIAMFYDLEEPRKFVEGVKSVLHPEGVWIIQMSYLPLMLKTNDFCNVCHEHLEYYSLRSLEHLLSLHGLRVVDMTLNNVNGGSFRVYVRHGEAKEDGFGGPGYGREGAERLLGFRESESRMDLQLSRPYLEFADRVGRIRSDVTGFIREQLRAGKRVFVYGASTKGNTLLQYFGLDSSAIAAAAERNPGKWGRVTVGTRIPIISEAEARAARPDFFLVLPWHFLDEFVEREREFLGSGGRFIVPLPHFTLI